MAHFILLVLHAAALFVLPWALFVTVPLHLIYANNGAARARRLAQEPTPETHVRCPDCRELVRMDARKCKHCGCALVPQQPG